MSAQIIAISEHAGRRPAKDDKGRSISARAGAIRAAADGPKRMMHQATERGIVATNLHRILTRLERDPRPIPRVEVLRAVLRSPNPDSTKRLYEYALPENLGEESRKQRERKLARKAKGYMRFVEAAAALAKLPEDELLVELFAGTSYDQPQNAPDYGDEVYELLDKLNGLVRWVVAQVDLERYWREAEDTRGAYDIFEGAIYPSARLLSTKWDLSGGHIEHAEDIPPIPEVPLFEYQEPRVIRARLNTQNEAGDWQDRGEADVRVFRQVRLAVAGVGGTLKPVFAVYTHIIATAGELVLDAMHTDGEYTVSRLTPPPPEPLMCNWVPVRSDGRIAGYTTVCVDDGQWRAARLSYGDTACPIPHQAPLPFNDNDYPFGCEPWWVVLLPVTDKTVAAYCSMPIPNYTTNVMFSLPPEWGATVWPAGTLGEAIEVNLLYAQGGRLDDRLIADAEAKFGLLTAYRAKAAAERIAAETALDEKWNGKGK